MFHIFSKKNFRIFFCQSYFFKIILKNQKLYMHFFSFHNANMTYPFLYTTTNHSCCVLVPQLGGLGLLLAAGHCLPVHLRPPLLHTAFPRLLQVLQCASPQPFYRSPTTLPSFTTSTNFTAATTRLSVRPAARPHCREEARSLARPGLLPTLAP